MPCKLSIVYFFVSLLPLVSAQAVLDPAAVWDSLLKQDPSAKGMLVYCNVTGYDPSQCATNFFGPDPAHPSVYSNAVAVQAAAKCVQKNSLDRVDSIMSMFHVDMAAMVMTAEGPSTPSGGYSTGTREAAGAQAKKEYIQKMEDLHKLEDTSLASIFMDDHDKQAELAFKVGQAVKDQIMGEEQLEYKKAYEDPSSQGFKPDLPETPPATTPDTPPPTTPDTPPPTTPDTPPVATPDTQPPPEATPDTFPDHMDDDDFDSEPKDSATPDVSPELVSTPMLMDDELKTSMQTCQEEEEMKLWKQIGISTVDPNVTTDDDERLYAEELLAQGACYTKYYGAEYCQAWKNEQATVEPPPEMQEMKDIFIDAHPLCPVNLVSEMTCHMAQEEILKTYVMAGDGAELLAAMFKPTKPLTVVPERINLDLKGLTTPLPGIVPGKNGFRRSRHIRKALLIR